jgi:ribonuclease HI
MLAKKYLGNIKNQNLLMAGSVFPTAVDSIVPIASTKNEIGASEPTTRPTKLKCYTDGSCRGNPGPGGWGVYIKSNTDEIYEMSGGPGTSGPITTNNKMELTAALKSLEFVLSNWIPSILSDIKVTIISDSTYLLDGIKTWILNWKKNDWKTSSKQPVKNVKLWKKIDCTASRLRTLVKTLKWKWIKAHNGDFGNEAADRLAKSWADKCVFPTAVDSLVPITPTIDLAVDSIAPITSTKIEIGASEPTTHPTKLKCYTDGSCFGNPGPGGWGGYIKSDTGEIYEISGGPGNSGPITTNNEMELTAALKSLEFVLSHWIPSILSDIKVTIISDSTYLIDGIKKWILNWKKNDWKTTSKQPVKNLKLWKELDCTASRLRTMVKTLKWKWIKAHNGDFGNEAADRLAKSWAVGQS